MGDDYLQYNNAKYWQIGLFSLNNAATNLYMALMGYITYYANSIAGFGVVLISFLLTAMNIFDGVTDPLVGFFLDKTKGKYGKFRPFMIIGNVLMGGSVLLLFKTTHLAPKYIRVPYFIVVYAIFVIGYTLQTVVGKSGQTVITNNPKQRPVSTYFDSLYIMAAYGGVALFVSNYLIPKYKNFKNAELFNEYAFWVVLISGVATALAVVGIWGKDQEKYYGGSDKVQKIQFSSYWDIIRHNRPIRMLIIAACTNRFAATVYGHTAVSVMLFGIMMDNYSIAGLIGVITAVPTLFVVTAGIRVAQKMGQKQALVLFTGLGILFQMAMMGILAKDNVNTITMTPSKLNKISLLFIGIFILLNGCKSITNNMVVPMIADCSDYEVYRSGKYVPGLMGALFSFVDKVFVALGTAFVGIVLAAVGYNKKLPQVTDELSLGIRGTTLFLYCVMPILGWIVSLLAMKFYKLDKARMKKIQQRIHAGK
ncbi:MFS transporter [Lachnospiraceae bacterium ZAX-1]